MELKAWRELAFLREKWIRTVMFRTRNFLEYRDKLPDDKVENLEKLLESINNPDKWHHYGVLNAEDKAQMELLEYLLHDEQTEINRYRHQPFVQ